MQDSQRFAAQSQDSQRRAMTRSAEPGLATICSAEPRLAAQMQDSQRRCRTRSADAGLATICSRQESRRRARTRSAEPGLAAQRQESRRGGRTPIAEAGLAAHSHRIGWTRSGSRQKLTEAHRSPCEPPHIPYHTIPYQIHASRQSELCSWQASTIGAKRQ